MKVKKAVSPKVTAIGANTMNDTNDSLSFTPGPWKMGKADPANNQIPVMASGLTQTMKVWKDEVAMILPRPHYANNQEANARLIASAPELLTMLVAVEISLKMNGDDKKYPTMMEAINSAISHAEGK